MQLELGIHFLTKIGFLSFRHGLQTYGPHGINDSLGVVVAS